VLAREQQPGPKSLEKPQGELKRPGWCLPGRETPLPHNCPWNR